MNADETKSSATVSDEAEAALYFHRNGWVPVHVERQGKIPTGGKGWQTLRPTQAEMSTWHGCNVGVLLGKASGWLVDIDLDCDAAVKLAPLYLPSTWGFGRASKPRSHWLYIAEGTITRQFRDADEKMMVEIRGESANGSGSQTVMPPSTHVTGERIEWDADSLDSTEAPRRIDASELLRAVVKLARATLLINDGASVAEACDFVANYKPQPRVAVAPRSSHRRGSGDVVGRARKYLNRMPEAVSEQGGHLALYRAAVALVRGFELDEDTALAMLAQDYNPRCQPAWKTRELEHKVRQAATRSTIPRGYLLDGASR